MQLPKELTTVTTFSKYLALSLFVILPILTFFLGMRYSQLTYTSMMPEVVYTRPPSISASTPTLTPDISSWKTYTNNIYKFEIKYPEGLKVIGEGKEGKFWILELSTKNKDLEVIVNILPNPKTHYGQPINKLEDSYNAVDNAEFFSLQGYPAMKYETKSVNGKTLNLRVLKDKVLWNIYSTTSLSDNNDMNTYSQILSTFKFLN